MTSTPPPTIPLHHLAATALLLALPHTTLAQPITSMVDWRGQLQLAETSRTLIVAPHALADARGITLADLREYRVTRYNYDGQLLRPLGRRGGGPGEFESPPLSARTTPGGDVFVAEFGGRVHIFPVSSDSATTFRVPLFPFYDARPLDDDRLLLVGWGPLAERPRGDVVKLLHVWSHREQRVIRSFFDLPVPPSLLAPARAFGSVSTDVSGDTIVATFSLSDTVYRFSLATGAQLGKTPIRTPLLKRAGDAPSIATGTTSRAKWLEQVSLIDAVHVLPDGRLLAQFSERFGASRRYRLLLLSRTGAVVAQASDAPQLMAVRPRAEGVALFFRGDDDEPAVWRIAELKR